MGPPAIYEKLDLPDGGLWVRKRTGSRRRVFALAAPWDTQRANEETR